MCLCVRDSKYAHDLARGLRGHVRATNGPTFSTPTPLTRPVWCILPYEMFPAFLFLWERPGTPMVNNVRMQSELTNVPPFVTAPPGGIVHIGRGARCIPSVLSVSLPTGQFPCHLHMCVTPCFGRSLSVLEVGGFRRCLRNWVPQYLRQVKMVTTYRSPVSTYEACLYVECLERRESKPMPRLCTAVLPLHDRTK